MVFVSVTVNEPAALVSVIIPVRNGMPFIRDAVASAAEQSWKATEVIVADDGSTDGTVDWVRTCGYGNVRLIAGARAGAGACAARNAGVTAASGEFIQFLDADDFLGPGKLELQTRQLLECSDPESTISFSRLIHFRDHDSGRQVSWHDTPFATTEPLNLLIQILISGRYIQTGQWLLHRRLAERAGVWDETLAADQDGDFFARVLAHARCAVGCPDAAVYYRRSIGDRQISAGLTPRHFRSRLRALDAKLQLLNSIASPEQQRSIITKQYGQLAFGSYPACRGVSAACVQVMAAHGIPFRPEFPTARLNRISRLFGWKVARFCSYLKHRGQG